MKRIVLFDGHCHFCNASVQFIIQRDPAAYFHFASLDSEIGERLKNQFGISEKEDSIVLIDNKKVFTKSSAALQIAKKLDGMWHLLFLFILIPRPIRDVLYNYIAKNRYKWFGKKAHTCTLPSPEIRKRFLSS